jgi:hypothetical protein
MMATHTCPQGWQRFLFKRLIGDISWPPGYESLLHGLGRRERPGHMQVSHFGQSQRLSQRPRVPVRQ